MLSSRKRTFWIAGLILGGIALACTCGPVQQAQQIQQTVGAAQATIAPALTEYNENKPTLDAALTAIAELGTEQPGGTPSGPGEDLMVHQWASSATASSQYGDDSWSASQAVGAPNVDACGDNGSAWASATQTERATLTLTFDTPVVPARILVTHSYYPTSLVQVDVQDTQGNRTTVANKPATLTSTCPFTETLTVSGVNAKINTVILTVDQAQIGSWDEIDAVELVGIP